MEERETRRRSSFPVEIVLVRHGEPDWDAARRGGRDPALTPRGREQAERTAARLSAQPLDVLYCSPLERARETASLIGARTQQAAEVVPAFEEIRVPLQGQASQTEVDEYFAAAARRPLGEHWDGFPGGESFRGFHARIVEGIEMVLARHGIHPRIAGEFTVWNAPSRGSALRIGIVAHGGANSVILTHLLGIPSVPWEWIRFETPLAAFSVVALSPINDRHYIWSLQRFAQRD
ncbi:MAG TPA: histidine phosphatase family protein [Terriglobia bacterium]|nr:histidine phosphatase family protein [Terriglobia bacterium]